MKHKGKHNHKELDLSDKDLAALNSKTGLKKLFAEKKINLDKVLRLTYYELELRGLQVELIKLQNWVRKEGKRVVVLFEGRDAAGKSGAIRRTTAHINPRYFRIVALPNPTEEEKGEWYFKRYVNRLPKPGEIVFFDRSWYNRAVVEPVNGFCTTKEYKTFMGQVNHFEKMIVDSGTYLIKFYFSISKKEQEKRFSEIKSNPLKKWRFTKVDSKAQELWDKYTDYKEAMFKKTNLKRNPWIIIEADIKSIARIEAIKYLLRAIPYDKSIEA